MEPAGFASKRGVERVQKSKVHPSAVVDSNAVIGAGCVIGPFCVIGALVRMGQRNVIRPHAVIVGATTIGDDNQFRYVSVGVDCSRCGCWFGCECW